MILHVVVQNFFVSVCFTTVFLCFNAITQVVLLCGHWWRDHCTVSLASGLPAWSVVISAAGATRHQDMCCKKQFVSRNTTTKHPKAIKYRVWSTYTSPCFITTVLIFEAQRCGDVFFVNSQLLSLEQFWIPHFSITQPEVLTKDVVQPCTLLPMRAPQRWVFCRL